MATRLTAAVLLLALLNACASQRVVRLDTGQGEPIEYRPPTSNKSVRVDAEAFEGALTQLVLEVPLTLRPPQQGWLVRASYPSDDPDTRWQSLIYLGVETFLEVVDASRELKWASDRATTWEELEHASQRFANRVGPAVARVFVLAVTVVVSHGMIGGSAWLASRLAMLPSFSEAAALGASQLRLTLSEIGQVSAVAVSAEGTITITLAPTAVAMTAGKTSTGEGTSEGALEIAEAGGRHAGFLRNYQGKPPGELRRGIDSLKKQIAEHNDKIANPEKYIPNWKSLDPRQQKALLDKKWPSDIQRQTEQLEILEGLLKKALGSGPT